MRSSCWLGDLVWVSGTTVCLNYSSGQIKSRLKWVSRSDSILRLGVVTVSSRTHCTLLQSSFCSAERTCSKIDQIDLFHISVCTWTRHGVFGSFFNYFTSHGILFVLFWTVILHWSQWRVWFIFPLQGAGPCRKAEVPGCAGLMFKL